jgi:hypothetical protein
LAAASDEQYESIPDDEIALLVRKFCALHKFRKERRRSPRGYFECDDTIHFIADYPKRKKLDSSSNKYDYTKRNDYNKDEGKEMYRFGDKKKKKFQKMMSRVCPALSDLDFSSDDKKKHRFGDKKKKKFQKIMSRACVALSDFNFSSDEEDEKVKCKPGDFTSLYLMGKSSQHIFDSDVSDDLSSEGLSLRVVELENTLCNQDKLL